MKKQAGFIVMSVILIFAVISFSGCSKKKVEINLSDYLKTDFSGFDGYGNFSGEIDVNRILDEYEKDLGDKAMDALRLLRQVEIKADKMTGLSNGEQLKVSFESFNAGEILEKGGLTVNAGENVITVSGLKELENIDVFKNVSLKFKGRNGEGEAEIELSDQDAEYSFIKYDLDKFNGLSNGDTVKVTVSDTNGSNLDEKLADIGKVLISKEKTYTVSDLLIPKEYDPFSKVSVSFEGNEGSAKAVLEIESDEYSNHFRYELDKQDNLSNGDVITLSVKTSYGDIKSIESELNIVVISTSKEFKVEGLLEALENIDQIGSTVFEGLKEADLTKVNALFSEGIEGRLEKDSLRKVDYIGSAIGHRDRNESIDDYTALLNIYRLDVNCSYEDPVWVYWYALYELKHDENGKFIYDDLKEETPYDNFSLNSGVPEGEVIISQDGEHFYPGFDSADSVLSNKFSDVNIVYNDIKEDGELKHYRAGYAKLLVSDKAGNSSENDDTKNNEADIYNAGEIKIVLGRISEKDESTENPLTLFEIDICKDDDNVDLSTVVIKNIKVVVDSNEIEIKKKRIKNIFSDEGNLRVVLYSEADGVEGKKAALTLPNLDFDELVVTFDISDKSNEPEEEPGEEPGKEEPGEEPGKEEPGEEPGKEEPGEEEPGEEPGKEEPGEEEPGEEPGKEEPGEEPGKEEPGKEEPGEEEPGKEEPGEEPGEEESGKEEPGKEEPDTEEPGNEDAKKKYQVVLDGLGPDKIRMIKTVMDMTERSLKDSLDLVEAIENEPQELFTTEDENLAKQGKELFEVYGATVTITEI